MKTRNFRGKILLALLVVALVPVGITLVAGTGVLREIVATAGTAGPWEAVAESGRTLLAVLEDDLASEADVRQAAREHREALSESARLSRLYAFVGDRFLGALPYFVVAVGLLTAFLAYIAARSLARSLARPVQELVGWTERIGRGEPLPEPAAESSTDPAEFRKLKDAFRDMGAELEEGRRRAVEAARLRSWTEMARGLAHELKNPLTPMRMAATAVHRLEDPRAVEAGEVLLEEIERLDEMARSFSQLGRLPEGPPSEVDLVELLEELVRLHSEGSGKVHLECHPGTPRIEGHPEALSRIFRNLLVNALEAAEQEGGERVEVTVTPLDRGAEVRIEDDGPGLPESAPDRIWEADFSTKRRGSGLGLVLARQAVRLHGGEIEARNGQEGGAVFSVRLPPSIPRQHGNP